MNILIITARYYPEQWAINRFAEGFVSKGHNVTVITGVPHYGQKKIKEGYEDVYDQVINGVRVLRIKEHIRSDDSKKTLILNYLSIFQLFPKKLKNIKGEFDIVFSHVMSPIFTMRGITNFCKKRKIPHIHYGFDLWPESLLATGSFSRDSLVFKIMKKYSRKLYSSIDKLLYASPSPESYFRDYLNLPNIPFKHIYQPTYTQLPPLEQTLNHDFKKGGKLKILFAGSIVKFNNMGVMMDALSICKEKSNVEYHVLGSGSEEENMKSKVRELELNNVFFHGRVPAEETISFLLDADVLFIPLAMNSKTSLMIPQKVIEYLMFGRPILGMLQGDGRDILEKASKGNIFSEETKESLANAIDGFYNLGKEELDKTGKENRIYFENEPRFSFETILDEILFEVDTLVKKNKARKSEVK